MKTTRSSEDYLETILILQNRNQEVRAIDIANELNYSKASVSRAVNKLKEADFLEVDDDNLIILTEKGYLKANKIYERHLLITRFFVEVLGLEPKKAETEACLIEHVISNETFNALQKHYYEIKKDHE